MVCLSRNADFFRSFLSSRADSGCAAIRRVGLKGALLNNALFLVLGLFMALLTPVFAHEDILLLKDVKVGMKGIGKTVIRGRDIETFNIEVMGILVNNKINENVLINGKSILVRVSGKVIDDAGGIAAGMSGSPIYINGKLIGGLSSGWVMTDHTVGLITPIEEMLEIWDYPLMTARPCEDKPVRWTCREPISLDGTLVKAIWETSDTDEVKAAPGEAVFLHAATPVIIQGLCDRAASLFGKRFKGHVIQAPADNMVPPSSRGVSQAPGMLTAAATPVPTTPTAVIPTTGSGSVTASLPPAPQPITDGFEPGSAVGVQLARGDINLTTLGTLTYRDGKRILAFAHPFLKKGNVSYLMTQAHIYHSFSSVQMPFKIGAPTETIGMITQDREKGIAGELGRFPAMVPIQLDVTDKDLKRSRSINYQVVRDPGVMISILESTMLQAIEGVIDRSGEGTALMGIALECTGSSGAKYNFRRENLFYSRGDIVNTLINEVTSLIENVTESDVEEVSPTRLMLKIDLERKRRTLTIEKVEVKNTSVTPGGVLEVWVTMRPFREKSIVQKARLPIPHDIGKDNLRLTVMGNASRNQEADDEPLTPGEAASAKSAKPGKDGKSSSREKEKAAEHETFDQVVRDWTTAPRNSDLLFQLSSEADEEKKIKVDGKEFHVQATNLVVLGSVDTTITLSEE
ncbi:MAG: SpoIVB peptidase S55 domain-containing protein [Candidatus Ozemobacteraceae bacterium]